MIPRVSQTCARGRGRPRRIVVHLSCSSFS